MTLIALTLNQGAPIMIGDILLTSKNGQGQNVILPTALKGTGDFLTNLETNRKAYPIALAQKIYIINPQLIVGLAGNVSQMTTFLKVIRSQFSDKFPSKSALSQFLDWYYKEKTPTDLSYLLLLVQPNGQGEIFCTPDKKVAITNAMGNVFAIGTGKETFIAYSSEMTNGNYKIIDGKKVVENNLLKDALQKNLQVLTRCIGSEAFHMNSVAEAWGAGYEVILYEEDGFRKLDDITVVILNANYDVESQHIVGYQTISVMKYSYSNNELNISASNNETNRVFIASEIDKDFTFHGKDIENKIDFNSETTILYVQVKLPSKPRADTFQIIFLHKKKSKILL